MLTRIRGVQKFTSDGEVRVLLVGNKVQKQKNKKIHEIRKKAQSFSDFSFSKERLLRFFFFADVGVLLVYYRVSSRLVRVLLLLVLVVLLVLVGMHLLVLTSCPAPPCADALSCSSLC